MPQYYTYLLKNSIDNQPFYAGKGSGSRMYQHLKEAVCNDYEKRSVHHKILAIQKQGGSVLYDKFMQPSEQDAFAEEKRLIALYGRKDLGTGILCNLTDGGEGTHQSPESIEKRAAKHRGMKRTEESKQRMKQAQHKIVEQNIALYKQKRSPESIKKQVNKIRGRSWSEAARTVKRNKPTAAPVLVFKKETEEFVGEWESISLCARDLSLDWSAIWKILSGRPSPSSSGKMYPYRTHKGYIFRYKD